MRITSDDVKSVQQGVDVTYEEAERFLIRSGGDVALAIRMAKAKRDSSFNKFVEEMKRAGREILTYYVCIKKKERIFLDLPLVLILLFFVFVNLDTKIWMFVVSIGIILISESHVSLYKKEDQDEACVDRETSQDESSNKVHKQTVDVNVSHKVEMPGDQIEKQNEIKVGSKSDDDDDYYEITIEK